MAENVSIKKILYFNYMVVGSMPHEFTSILNFINYNAGDAQFRCQLKIYHDAKIIIFNLFSRLLVFSSTQKVLFMQNELKCKN